MSLKGREFSIAGDREARYSKHVKDLMFCCLLEGRGATWEGRQVTSRNRVAPADSKKSGLLSTFTRHWILPT